MVSSELRILPGSVCDKFEPSTRTAKLALFFVGWGRVRACGVRSCTWGSWCSACFIFYLSFLLWYCNDRICKSLLRIMLLFCNTLFCFSKKKSLVTLVRVHQWVNFSLPGKGVIFLINSVLFSPWRISQTVARTSLGEHNGKNKNSLSNHHMKVAIFGLKQLCLIFLLSIHNGILHVNFKYQVKIDNFTPMVS